ncbi:MAG: cupin domain-containing protein [Alphaproteobacteria bacterium]|nr:cupin domain-containing protein [Alphaproteobacteria bacterium]
MATVIDLNAELAKLRQCARTPQMTNAERAGSAAELGQYRDGALFTSKFAGTGAWERHPNGQELVHVLDGAAMLDLVPMNGDPQSISVKAGMMVVVPQGTWHRFRSAEGITLMTATPRPSEHVRLDIDDPRTVEPPTQQQGGSR